MYALQNLPSRESFAPDAILDHRPVMVNFTLKGAFAPTDCVLPQAVVAAP